MAASAHPDDVIGRTLAEYEIVNGQMYFVAPNGRRDPIGGVVNQINLVIQSGDTRMTGQNSLLERVLDSMPTDLAYLL